MPISLSSFRFKQMLLFGVLIFVIAGIVGGVWYWRRPKIAADRVVALESYEVVEAVGKLIELPEGEVPTVATVTQESKLLDQPFFVAAETGDKVLFYPQARKALLYRPSNNKLIEVTSLVVTTPTE